MQRLGEKLRILRLQRGLSLRDLAVALGHPPSFNSYLSDVENGRRIPKLGFVLQLAAFFQVSMDQFTGSPALSVRGAFLMRPAPVDATDQSWPGHTYCV